MQLITLVAAAMVGLSAAQRGINNRPILSCPRGGSACLTELTTLPQVEADYICRRLTQRPTTIFRTQTDLATSTRTNVITLVSKTTVDTETVATTRTLRPIVQKRMEDINVQEAYLEARDGISLRACPSIDALKAACDCFLDLERVPKYVFLPTDVTSTTVTQTFTQTTTTVSRTKTVASPTVTIAAPNCNVRYRPTQPINPFGTTTLVVPDVDGGLDCCQQCTATENCILASYGPGTFSDIYQGQGLPTIGPQTCVLLIQDQQLPGAPITDNCPFGAFNVQFGGPDGSGNVFAGPCGY